MNPSLTIIAVDGPAASGKSSVSRMVARKLGYNHVDTGAMYRAVTWKAIEAGIDLANESAVLGLLRDANVTFELDDGSIRMLLDGVFPGDAVRAPRVADKVSIVAAMAEVRQILVEQQRSLTKFGHLVVEGRDIGSVVFPDTPYKFYITADPNVRAQRRQKDLAALNIQTSTDAVAQNLQTRDRIDSSRATAPLQVPAGATVIDTSLSNVEETADIVISHIRRQMALRQ